MLETTLGLCLLWILCSLFALVVCLVIYARWNYGTLEKLGIPVIKPHFFLGSAPDLHRVVQHYEDIRRFKKYGGVWGMYQGRTPIVYVCDPELIRRIYVKDVEHFFDRDAIDLGSDLLMEMLDFLPGEKWKTMRVVQTRLFSSSKIKQMSNDTFSMCAEELVSTLKNATNDGRVKVDLRDQYHRFTIDVISRCGFSMKTDPSDPQNAFYRGWKKFVGEGQTYAWLYTLSLTFAMLSRYVPTHELDPCIVETFREILSDRRKKNVRCNDFGDIMNDCMSKLESNDYTRLGITETTLLAQMVNLFIAGFDRISTAMSFFCYYMAQNTHLQDRLHEEIDQIICDQHDGRIDSESVANMPFLTACVSETLRLCPVLIRPERVCTKDWSWSERGICITKGVVVMIPTWAANRNPDIYPDPDEFSPERFLPENKSDLNPYAFSTFGFGHRNCIGMRFAYEAIKIGLCNIFKDFRTELRPDTKIDFKPGVLMLVQYSPLYLDLVRR